MDAWNVDFTNVAGQSVFETPYTKFSAENVYLNGMRLRRDIDYTIVYRTAEENLTTITLTTAIPDNADTLSVTSPYLEDLGNINFDEIMPKLDDILTATMGSWSWDKTSGVLTLYDVTGVEKFKYAVSDDAQKATRERRQDLEV